MPRATTPLNDTQIKNAKPKASEYLLSDGGGLGLRIKKNGSKTWLFNYYRPHIKKRAQISFGVYPAITLAAARKKRDEARALLANDIDPKEYREEIQSTKATEAKNTFEAVATEWLKLKTVKVSERHSFNILRGFEIHVYPALGKVPISKLSAQLTIETLRPLEAANKLDMLGRLCQRINEVMDYAVNTGRMPINHLHSIAKAFDTVKHTNMPTVAPEQLPMLLATVNDARLKLITKCLFEWQLHTMARPSEAAGAMWNEIDFDNRVWNIPAERMKKAQTASNPFNSASISPIRVFKTY